MSPPGKSKRYGPRHAAHKSRLRWVLLAGGAGSTAVAVAVAYTAGIREPACASDPTSHRGRAVVHSRGDAPGRCSYGPPPSSGLYAAVSTAEYDGAAACGSYLDVTGPRGTTVRVQVTDHCPGCSRGQLDLGRRAFKRLTRKTTGAATVTYRQVRDPRPAERLAVRAKAGSSVYWLALLITGHGNPLTRVEARRSGHSSWRRLTRGWDNHWTLSPGAGRRFDVRVSDSRDNRVSIRKVRLKPDRVQRTGVLLYGEPTAESSPSPSAPPAPAPDHAPADQPANCGAREPVERL